MEMKCSNCGEVYYDGHICRYNGATGLPSTGTNIAMPPVKEPKNSLGGFTVSVDTEGLEEALAKSHELVGILQKIDGLTGRIARDIDKINRYALGKSI